MGTGLRGAAGQPIWASPVAGAFNPVPVNFGSCGGQGATPSLMHLDLSVQRGIDLDHWDPNLATCFRSMVLPCRRIVDGELSQAEHICHT